MILKNKVAVVTGASDGIGKEVALKLARVGVLLALIGRDQTKLESTKQEAEKLGSSNVRIYPCDIRETKDFVDVTAKIINEFTNIHILVNIAGIWQKVDKLENISDDVIDDVIQTNLNALIHCVHSFLPNLKKQEEAAIINISSKSGVTAPLGQSVYAASKWGVRGFTEVLKADLKGSSVRVAGVYQAGTNTKMFEKAGDDFPVQKFTNPSDLAEVIVFMLSRPKQIWLHDVRVEY